MLHRHRDSLRSHASQQIRYGGGHTWIHRRYPGSRLSRPLTTQLPLSAAGALRRAVVGDWEWSLFHLMDGATAMMLSVGKFRGNRVPVNQEATSIVVVADCWPDASEDAARRVVGKGLAETPSMHVEARQRPVRIARDALHELPSHYMEDDSPLERLQGIAWLLARRPSQTARSVLRRGSAGVSIAAVRRLAPAARRIAQAGAIQVQSADMASVGDALALAELLESIHGASVRSETPANAGQGQSVPGKPRRSSDRLEPSATEQSRPQ